MNALRAYRATAGTSRALLAVRAASTTAGAAPIRSSTSAVPLANVEAQWSGLTAEEQVEVHRELEDLQKRDWKTLSIDEKKAGESVSDLCQTFSHPARCRCVEEI
jgi:cytochrome c oxidase subunit 4